MRQNKFNAKRAYRCSSCGAALRADLPACLTKGCNSITIKFDSQAEAKRWDQLRLLERAGKITHLRRQVPFELLCRGGTIGKYIADFVYCEEAMAGAAKAEDVKGVDTPLSKWKRKHCELQYGIKIEVVR